MRTRSAGRRAARRLAAPRFEAMEARPLLATVTGTLVSAPSGALAGRTVFVDVLGTGRIAAGDPSAVTGSDGSFTIAGVPAGSYSVQPASRPGESYSRRPVTVAADSTATIDPLSIASGSPALLMAYGTSTRFGTPPANAIQGEVNALYRTILFRDPDAGGAAAAATFLRGGGSTAQLASTLLTSAEARLNTARFDYLTILGRDPSASEVGGWANNLADGATEEQVAAAFFASAEYSRLHASNADFASSVYVGILGRAASPSEVTAVSGFLAGGLSRAGLVGSLFGSTEGVNRAVSGLYVEVLGRRPDAGGGAAAAKALQSGSARVATLATALFGSAEFFAQARLAAVPAALDIPNRTDVAFGTDGVLYIADGPQVDRYDTLQGAFLESWQVGGYAWGMDVSPDGKTLVVADGSQPGIELITIATGAITRVHFTPLGDEVGTYSVAWGSDGAVLASMISPATQAATASLRRFDPASGAATIVASGEPPFGLLSASGDRRTIVMASARTAPGRLLVYSVTAGRALGSSNPAPFSYTVATNADGSQVAVSGGNATYVYNVAGGNITDGPVIYATPPGGGDTAGAVDAAYSPTSRFLFTAEVGATGGIKVYDTTSLTVVATLDPRAFVYDGQAFGAGRMRVSPDGRSLAVTTPTGVKIYDVSAYARG